MLPVDVSFDASLENKECEGFETRSANMSVLRSVHNGLVSNIVLVLLPVESTGPHMDLTRTKKSGEGDPR